MFLKQMVILIALKSLLHVIATCLKRILETGETLRIQVNDLILVQGF